MGGLACLALLPVRAVLLCRLRLVHSGIIDVVWVDGRCVDCGGCVGSVDCSGCMVDGRCEDCGGWVEWIVDVCRGLCMMPCAKTFARKKKPGFTGDHSMLINPCNNPCHRSAKLPNVQTDPFMLTSTIHG